MSSTNPTTTAGGGAPPTTLTGSTTTTSPTHSSISQSVTNLGLGYAIAIALGFLVLLSTVLLASYVCCRASRPRSRHSRNPNPNSASDGIILPRVIFVAEDDDDDAADENPAAGLDQTVINSYPKFPFVKSGDLGNAGTMCSICLCEYRESEMVRMMPDCRHYFHLLCIDAWLKLNGSCPVCRNSPLPTPLSTPLSELVPLSQYPAQRRR
ncbi:RING-H2 finger protein ATL67-like [Malania oleifera]|uniref:RING-H2 finger protein ATL67-like n=1 Tax=Malania oleifera TaxID=397392 RepID=UPI0025AE95E1|nr:RING-H2 finger protein ATL67-like [Malania oleifera]